MKHFLFLFLLLTVSIVGFAQPDQTEMEEVVQFSGVVVTGDSLYPVPMASVYRSRDMRGTVADYNGFYTLPAYKGDTIVFSSIGFRDHAFIIPDTLSNRRLAIVQILQKDTIDLPVTYIYPYPVPAKFKEEFLALNLADDELTISRKNLESVMMYDRMMEMSPSPSENYKMVQQQRADQLYYSGQANPISLLNPISWAKFIQSWRNGDLKKQ